MHIPREAVEALARWECAQDGEDFSIAETREAYIFHAQRRLTIVAPLLNGPQPSDG